MKILFSDVYDFDYEQLVKVKKLGYDVTVWRDGNYGDSSNPMDYEVLVCNAAATNVDFDKFNKLKMVQLSSAGFDRIPVKELKDRGVQIANARGVYSIPIAEFTILKILEIYKKTREFEEDQRNKEWNKKKRLTELYGKTVGIIGTGSIASEISIRAKAFGCSVIGANTSGNDVEHFDRVYKSEDLDTLLEKSDIVISTVPINDSTRNMINKDNLKYMKNDGVLINIARGGIINEEDLFEHLEDGKLMGVALDVFEREPLPEDSPLWEHPRVLITPHNSFSSENIKDRTFQLIYNNLKAFIENKPIKNLI